MLRRLLQLDLPLPYIRGRPCPMFGAYPCSCCMSRCRSLGRWGMQLMRVALRSFCMSVVSNKSLQYGCNSST